MEGNEKITIWYQTKESQWLPGILLKNKENKLIIKSIEGKEIIQIKEEEEENKIDINNPKYYKRDNESDLLSPISDMTSLKYLNEPEMLHCIRRRYSNNLIYTGVGPILIVVNPCQQLPIYGKELALRYYNANIGESRELGPHVYQLSNTAYQRMIVDKFNPDDRENQVILINGDSGAGKTETTKQVLEYLSLISSELFSDISMNGVDTTNIQKLIMSVNPITESFGNAKTCRNNNSSRFGKMIDLFYCSDGYIEGVNISTYLLETIRVTFQLPNERNYRIFYELFAGLDNEKKKKWNFNFLESFHYMNNTLIHATSFNNNSNNNNNNNNNVINTISPRNSIYSTNQTNSTRGSTRRSLFTRIVEVDTTSDLTNFQLLLSALHQINFTVDEIDHIFQAVVGILHLGNVTFLPITKENGSEGAEYSPECQEHIKLVCELLGLTPDLLLMALTKRQYLISNSKQTMIQKLLPVSSAITARDALARTLYEVLFTRLIDRINLTLNPEGTSNDDHASSISVLDVFGFEYYENNSFEQLCINYANEKLQDHFNFSIFKSQQEVYLAEGITWKVHTYPDSTERIDLFENKSTGLLNLCDEMLKLSSPNEAKLIANYYLKNLKKNSSFKGSKLLENNQEFIISHYACDVKYNVIGWIDKNKSDIALEIKNCIFESQNLILRSDFNEFDGEYSPLKNSNNINNNNNNNNNNNHNTSNFYNSNLNLNIGQNGEDILTSSPSPIRRKSIAITSRIKITSYEQRSLSLANDSSSMNSNGSGDNNNNNNNIYGNSSNSNNSNNNNNIQGSQLKSFLSVGKKINTILSQFAKQLNDLIKKIQSMRSHFIRCIKPNMILKSGLFEDDLVLLQLRCGGTLQAIQVYQDGFPHKMTFQYFLSRYSSFLCICGINYVTTEVKDCIKRAQLTGQLLYWRLGAFKLIDVIQFTMKILSLIEQQSSISSSSSSTTTTTTLSKISDDELHNSLQIGKTAVFLRTNVYEYLESIYLYCVTSIAKKLQRRWRAYQYIQKHNNGDITKRSLAFSLLSFSDSKLIKLKKILSSTVIIQRKYRIYTAMKKRRYALAAICYIQTIYRGYMVRLSIYKLKYNSATLIQTLFRKYYQQNLYYKKRIAISLLQKNIKWYLLTKWRRKALKSVKLIQRVERGRQCRNKTKLLYTESVRLKYEEKCRTLNLLEKKLKENPHLLEDIQHSEEMIKKLNEENNKLLTQNNENDIIITNLNNYINEYKSIEEINQITIHEILSQLQRIETISNTNTNTNTNSNDDNDHDNKDINNNIPIYTLLDNISKRIFKVESIINKINEKLLENENIITQQNNESYEQKNLFQEKITNFESIIEKLQNEKKDLITKINQYEENLLINKNQIEQDKLEIILLKDKVVNFDEINQQNNSKILESNIKYEELFHNYNKLKVDNNELSQDYKIIEKKLSEEIIKYQNLQQEIFDLSCTLNTTKEIFEEEKRNFNQTIIDYENKIKLIKIESDKMYENNQILTNNLSNSNIKIKNLEIDLTNINTKCLKLENNLVEFNINFENKSQELEKQNQILISNINEKEENINLLKDELNENRKQTKILEETLKKEKNNFLNTSEKLEYELNSLKNDLLNYKKIKENLEIQIEELKDNLTNKQELNDKLSNEILEYKNSTNQELSSLNIINCELETKLNTNQNLNRELGFKNDILRQELNESLKSFQVLQEEFKLIKEELENNKIDHLKELTKVKNELDHKINLNINLEKDINTLKQEINKLLELNKNLNLNYESNELLNKNLNKNIKELDNQIQLLVNDLHEKEQDIYSLKNEINDSINEKTKLQEKLNKEIQKLQQIELKKDHQIKNLEKDLNKFQIENDELMKNLQTIQIKSYETINKLESELSTSEFHLRSRTTSLEKLQLLYNDLLLQNNYLESEINHKNNIINEQKQLIDQNDEEIQNIKLYYDDLINEYEHKEQILMKKNEKLELRINQLDRKSVDKELKNLKESYNSLKNRYDELKKHFEHRKNIDILSNLMFQPSLKIESQFNSVLNMHGILNDGINHIFNKKWTPPLKLNIESINTFQRTINNSRMVRNTHINTHDNEDNNYVSIIVVSLHIRDINENWSVIPCLGDFEDYHWILDSNSTLISNEFPIYHFVLFSSTKDSNISSSLEVKLSSVNFALEQMPSNERENAIPQLMQEIQFLINTI